MRLSQTCSESKVHMLYFKASLVGHLDVISWRTDTRSSSRRMELSQEKSFVFNGAYRSSSFYVSVLMVSWMLDTAYAKVIG